MIIKMNDTYDRCFFHYVAFNSNLHRNESIFKDVIALNQIPPIFRLSRFLGGEVVFSV